MLDEVGRPEDRRVDRRCRAGPGCSSVQRLRRRPRVTSSVLAQGNFSTTSSRPGPSLMTASPISGCVALDDQSATSPSARGRGRCASTGDLGAGRRRLTIGSTCRMPEPLVGRVDEPAGADHRAEVGVAEQAGVQRSAVAVHHLLERHVVRGHARRGRPGPAACCSRSPQIATLATPGTRSSRARIVPVGRSSTASISDSPVGGHADLHDAAGRGQRRQHDRRRRPGRQRRRHRRQALLRPAAGRAAGRCRA